MLAEAGKEYKDLVAGICLQEHIEPIVGNVELDIMWFRPAARGDADAILKVLLDSLQGYVYTNDSQIRTFRVSLYEDRQNPRIELVAWEISLWYREFRR